MYSKQQIIEFATKGLAETYGITKPVREAQLKFVKFPINNNHDFYSAVSLLVDDTISPACKEIQY